MAEILQLQTRNRGNVREKAIIYRYNQEPERTAFIQSWCARGWTLVEYDVYAESGAYEAHILFKKWRECTQEDDL